MRFIVVLGILFCTYVCTPAIDTSTASTSHVTHHVTQTTHHHAGAHTTQRHHYNNHGHGHNHHEPNEHESFLFKYDPQIHIMAMVIFENHQKTCYAYKMSRDEQTDVYNYAGLRTVEFTVLNHIMQNQTVHPYTYDDLSARSFLLSNFCKNSTVFSVNYIP